ncbi:ubiquitin carboxyl-terminal hydrolase 47 [Plakobranchus ocellatus]|uniref:Ubiquitin carboxyl-terminal hydrolase 47 n=1 Tax=Plakobranchus ocellatus TaxID=259542 RepID=A0AAV4AYA6_9GAST|nr:ubiquitin carboxyl-terminal hydrolase 47 [Plakobranchus ocellatus]
MIVSSCSKEVPSHLDDENVLCIIRDLVDNNAGMVGKQSLNLQASLPARQAARDIARTCGYKHNCVSVHYEQQLGSGDIILGEQDEEVLLGSICTAGVKRHNFTIQELEGTNPEKLDDIVQKDNSQSVKFTISSCCDPSTEDSSSYQTISTIIKPESGHIGLVNQAMTCYLNSLLQTLFMTPEFRNALYRWSFDGTEEEKVKSIPYQLQRLFLQLQTSNKRAVETTDLTRSFGWDSSEVWQQHDVQELCRVMFDALEQQWKNTVQANLINQLYQGKLKDYVKCLECGYESARVDAYLDIPLVIRPFGSTEAYGSVREAMTAFVQPEILDGSNQYFCEKCNKKCNAHKGLKFVTFPYLLTLQLKRFDFDYATMHRIKLNDKVTFLEVLNLNPFITCDTKNGDDLEDEDEDDKLAGFSAGQVDSSDEGIDEGIDVETGCSAGSSSSDSSSISSDAAANNSRNAYDSDAKGPYVYELFSIMIHSGSAAGGHYYAYIKSFKDGQWFSFNDQQVTKITYEDIRKTYGGSALGRSFYSSAYTSSTSAYMLMYRQINKCLNADVMQPEDFPDHLKRELMMEREREEAERRQREIDKSTCKIKLYCFHPRDHQKMEAKLEIHKDKTLQEATEVARELLGLQNYVSPDCCRLVKYDEYQDSLEKSFEGEEATPISTLLGGVKASYTFDLLLETRRPEQMFVEYKPGGVTVKVFVVDIYRNIIQPPINVRAYHLQTVEEFKFTLSKVLGVPSENMRCVLERFHNDLSPLTDPLRTLKAEGFYKSNKVFVECSGDVHDCSVPYSKSRLYRLLDQYRHTISITCNLPSTKSVQEYLQSLKDPKPVRPAVRSSPVAGREEHPTAAGDSAQHPLLDEDKNCQLKPCAGDEGLSENDSAFFSGTTISKLSLSGADHCSSFSTSSCSTPADTHGNSTATCSVTVAEVRSATATSTSNCYTSVMASKPTSLSSVSQGSVAFEEGLGVGDTEVDTCAHRDENRPQESVVDNRASFHRLPSSAVAAASSVQSWCGFPSVNAHSYSTTNTTTTNTTSASSPSSREQLHVDLSALCSRLSSVGGSEFVRGALASSHSDPSIYHTMRDGNNSDDSMQCLGSSGGRSVSGSPEDSSAEFNLSPSLGPDPEPTLSSPEDGYGFEEDNLDEAQAVTGNEGYAIGSSVDPVSSNLQSLCKPYDLPLSGQYSNQLCSKQEDGAVCGASGDGVGRENVDEDDWWETDSREQPQPLASFLARTTSINDVRTAGSSRELSWDMDFSSVGGGGPSDDQSAAAEVEGCDINLSIKGRLRPVPPPPPPPPPPLPPMSTGFSHKLNLELVTDVKHWNGPDEQQQEDTEAAEESDLTRYFHAVVSQGLDSEERTLQVSVDKRTTFGAFKQRLEPFVGVASNLFKVYRVYSNNQEYESIRLSDTLSFFEDGKFNIKLGRALLPGEHRVKVFQLSVNEAEPCKFLVETIFAKGMSVLESKHILLEEIRAQCGMDIPLDRCRLRKKSWTNPCTIYLDTQIYETEISIYPNWEIFLEVLDGPEKYVDSDQLAVYVRHWHPSTHIVDRFQELVLTRRTVQELKAQISFISGIPVDCVEFAKAKGTFPCEVSVLEVQTYLEWNPHATDLKDWPLYICEDGSIVFFR